MSAEKLAGMAPVASRLPWMQGGDNVISARVVNGNVHAAVAVLMDHAKARGLKIVDAARYSKDGVDAVFVRGEPR